MVTIQPMMHWLFQLAQLSFVLSYASWNQLYLRVCIAIGGLLLAAWGLFQLSVAIDVVVWNLVLLIPTLFHIFLILRKKLVFRFSSEAESLYSKMFNKSLSRYQFKLLYENCIEEKVIQNPEYIKQGRVEFKQMIILGNLDPNNTKIQFAVWEKDQKRTVIMRKTPPYTWIGVVDYIRLLEKRKWDPKAISEGSTEAVVKSTSEEFTIFVLNLEKLDELFKNPNHGSNIRNAIYSKMLDFIAGFLINLDEYYVRTKDFLKR